MGESRPFGEHERLLHYLHVFGGLITLMALHLRGPLDVEVMGQALAWLQRRHPMLRAHVRTGGIGFRPVPPFVYLVPWFDTAGTGPIPLRVVAADWREVVTDELRRPLRGGKAPRVRFTLVPEGDLTHVILTTEHAIVDAQSLNLLSRDLLEYLADPGACEARPVHADHLSPPLEAGLRKLDRSTRPYEPAIRLPLRPEPGTRRRATKILVRRVDPATTAALKATARERGATLHGALTGAFLMAIREQFGLTAMTCMSSLDLRRFSTPRLPADTFGCYVDALRTRHDISTDFWRNARDVSFRLVAAIAKGHGSASMMKLPEWGVYAAETIGMMRTHMRLDGLGITTADDSGLGEHYGNLTLEGIAAGVSMEPVGPGVLAICCERSGGIDISLNYATRALSNVQASQLAGRAMAALESAVVPLPVVLA